MNKIELMNVWLDKQEAYHRSLGKGSGKLNRSNLQEEMNADAMMGVRNKIASKGWDETFKDISDTYENCKESNMVGPHALANSYSKIITKMRSLDWRESNE